MFDCKICFFQYKTLSGLNKHNEKCHKITIIDDKLKCNFCYINFKHRQSKWRHEKKCKTINNTPITEQITTLANTVADLQKEIKKTPTPIVKVIKTPTQSNPVNAQLLNIIVEKSLSINKLKQDLDELKTQELITNSYFSCKSDEPLKININNTMYIPRPTDNYFNASSICKLNKKDFNNWVTLDSTVIGIEILAMQLNITQPKLIEVSDNGDIWLHPILTLSLGQWISPHFMIQSCMWLTSFLLNYDDMKNQIANNNCEITTLKNICAKKQTRTNFPEQNVVYIVSTEDLLTKRIYIVGKAEELKSRLSTYNKTCEHQVIYYRGCGSVENMKMVEQLVLNKLEPYRERANRDRFVLPIDKPVSFMTNVVDTAVEFQLNWSSEIPQTNCTSTDKEIEV